MRRLFLAGIGTGLLFGFTSHAVGGNSRSGSLDLRPYLAKLTDLQSDFLLNRCRVFVVENRNTAHLDVVLAAGLGRETLRSSKVYRLDRLRDGILVYSEAGHYRLERALFVEKLAEFETLVNQRIQQGLCHPPDFIP